MANDTFRGDFDWLIGGDDDTFFFFSVLLPFLESLDANRPLFLGSPGPAPIGRWYCRQNNFRDDNHADSSLHRGPICCSNYTIPCRVSLPATSDDNPGKLYVFAASLRSRNTRNTFDSHHLMGKSGDNAELQYRRRSSWRLWTDSDCCRKSNNPTDKDQQEAPRTSDLLLVAKKCNDISCCQPEGGQAAKYFHWAKGHYPYGGAGWIVSRGLLRTPGNSARLRGDIGSTPREHWLQCAKAARCQPPDMGISTCVLNAGFAIAAVPPHILPTTSSSLKSTHADPRQSIGSDIYLKTMKPGTIVSGSSHHVTYEQVRAFTAIDRNPEGSLAREMAYWAYTKQLCGCDKAGKRRKRLWELSRRGVECVPSNCNDTAVYSSSRSSYDRKIFKGTGHQKERKSGMDTKKNSQLCCTCQPHVWRKVYSPLCQS